MKTENTLSKGQQVIIFERYLTSQHPEGLAELIKRIPSNADSETAQNWKVKFMSDGFICERMVAVPKSLGRPASVADGDRKQSYTVSCTINRRAALVKHFGSLSKALDAVRLPNSAKLLIIFALLCTLSSCSDVLCPAYNSYRTHSNRR